MKNKIIGALNKSGEFRKEGGDGSPIGRFEYADAPVKKPRKKRGPNKRTLVQVPVPKVAFENPYHQTIAESLFARGYDFKG
jgi:hypothetical protein